MPPDVSDADVTRWTVRCVEDDEVDCSDPVDRDIVFGFLWAVERITAAYVADAEAVCSYIHFLNDDLLGDPRYAVAHLRMMHMDPWVFYDHAVREAGEHFDKRKNSY
jgi:hypothetical protein